MKQKTLGAGRYFLGMQAGLGTRNVTHGLEMTTVCYETEKTLNAGRYFLGMQAGL